MGNSRSKEGTRSEEERLIPKSNKDHRRDKTFRIGLSFGKGDLSAEGHFQMGYVSKTKKVYTRFVNDPDDVRTEVFESIGVSVSEPIPIPDRSERSEQAKRVADEHLRSVTFQEEPDEELETNENS